jgi:CHASE2 domain-containing sensor protein
MKKGAGKKLFIPLACFAFTLPLLFTGADNKIYDLFLRVLPPLSEHEKVYVLTLDDDSIRYAGGVPLPPGSHGRCGAAAERTGSFFHHLRLKLS